MIQISLIVSLPSFFCYEWLLSWIIVFIQYVEFTNTVVSLLLNDSQQNLVSSLLFYLHNIYKTIWNDSSLVMTINVYHEVPQKKQISEWLKNKAQSYGLCCRRLKQLALACSSRLFAPTVLPTLKNSTLATIGKDKFRNTAPVNSIRSPKSI